MSGTQIRVAREREDDAPSWDAFVRDHPRGTAAHLARWRAVIRDLFGHETFYLRAEGPDGRLVGVLPLVRLRSVVFGDFLVSMPFLNYGGALGVDAGVEEALMREAGAIGRGLGASHVEFRDTVPRNEDWPVREDKVCMELALPDSPDTLRKAVGSKVRAQINRPLREGATVELGGAELVAEFFPVFARNMRDLGTPVYPRRFFERIAEAFAAAVHLVVVRVDGRAVAAGYLLRHGDRMEIPWASSLREYNRIGVNMLMYWRALEAAIEAGCARFDFGRSTVDSGTYRFKAQWGAKPSQLHWHYWLREGGSPPKLNPDNPRYALAIRMWQRLPVAVANVLGPRIVRNLP